MGEPKIFSFLCNAIIIMCINDFCSFFRSRIPMFGGDGVLGKFAGKFLCVLVGKEYSKDFLYEEFYV